MFGFGGNKQQQSNQQQQPNQQQQQQPNQQQQSQQQQPGNQNAGSNQPADPLAIYGKMFDNPSQTDAPPSFSIDPKVMDGVVSSQDFMQGINPETVQKAQQGDWSAIQEMIQHASRGAYRAAIEHGGVLTDKFVGSYSNYSSKKLPDVLKGHMTEQSLAANTPNFKNPVVKKQLTEIAQRLQRQNPDATAQEIADMSRQYLTDLMEAVNPQKQEQQQANAETDWDKFFD